jgi:glutaredoxin
MLASLLFVLSGNALAQYSYVAPDGTKTYTDVPPGDGVKHLVIQDLPKTPETLVAAAALPYELSRASSNFPVTFYAGDTCPSCDSARAFLKQRGIPFTEKKIQYAEDSAAMIKMFGSNTIPTITVGSHKSLGFNSGEWGGLLDDAGYPATSKLPRDYAYPPVTNLVKQNSTAAPAPAADPAAATPPANNPNAPLPSAPPPTGNAPPGFRF